MRRWVLSLIAPLYVTQAKPSVTTTWKEPAPTDFVIGMWIRLDGSSDAFAQNNPAKKSCAIVVERAGGERIEFATEAEFWERLQR